MKKDILVKDYLQQKQEELNIKNQRNQAKQKKSLKWMIVILCVIIVSAISITILSKISFNVKYNKFMNEYETYDTEQLSSDAELLENKDAYEIFENVALSNTNNNLINYGYYAAKNGYKIYESTDGLPMLQTDHFTKQLVDYQISYINITNDYIYFRNNNDRKIYKCDLNGENIQKVFDIKVGQFVISDNVLYYINFENNSKLYSYNISSNTNEQVIDDTVISFAKVGNEFIYLDYDSNVKKFNDIGISYIQSNVEKFYYNGSIIAQNNGKIVAFSARGTSPKLLISENAELLGADKDNIYYAVDADVYKYDESGTSTKIADGCDFYKAVYKTDNGFYIIGSVKNNSDNTYDDKVISVSGE